MADVTDQELLRLANEADTGDVTTAPEVKTESQVRQERESEGQNFLDVMQADVRAQEGEVSTETVKQAAGGVLDIGQDLINTTHDILDWGENWLAEMGIGEGDVFEPGKATTFAEKIIPPSANPVDNVVRGVVSYVMPYAGLSKIVTGGSKAIKASKALAGSAAINGVLMDPDEKRVADFANEVPMLSPLVPSWLLSDEDDEAFESRVKNSVESLLVDAGLAGLGTAVAKSFNMVRKGRKLKAAQKTGIPAVEESAVGDAIPSKETAKPKVEAKPVTPEEDEVLKALYEPSDFNAKDLETIQGANSLEELEAAFLETSKHAEIKKITALAKRGEIPQEETTLRAVGILANKKKFNEVLQRSHTPGEVLNAEEIRAVDIFTRAKVNEVVDFMENIKNFDGDDINLQAAVLKMQEAQVAMMGRNSTFSEIGRALNIAKVTDTMELSDLRREYLNQYMKVVGKDNAVDLVKEMDKIRKLKKPADLRNAIRAMGQGRLDTLSKKFQGYYLSNLIAGLGTTKTAMVGNASYGVVRSGELAIQGMISPFIKGASVGEVVSAARAIPTSFIEGLTNTKDFFVHSKLPTDITKQRFTDTKRVFTDTMESLGLAGETGSAWNKVVHTTGNLISGQGRLQAVDAFSRTVAKRSTMNQLVYRDAVEAGLKEGTEEFSQHMSKLIANPTPELINTVEGAASRAAFGARASEVPIIGTDDLNVGEVLNYFEKGLSRIPVVNVTVPFVRTATNLADFSVQRVPGINLLSPKIRAGFASGGAARAEAISKTIMGTSVLGAAAFLTHQGHMTGGNAASRKFKKKLTGDSRYGEYVLNIPGRDKPVKYDRLDPLGTLLGIGADLAEISGYVRDDNFTDHEELVGAAAILVKDLMIPEGPLNNFGDLARFLSDPKPGNVPLSLTGFIPMGGLVKEATKTGTVASDPIKRDTKSKAKGIMKAWDEVFNKALDTIGLGKDMPPLLNVLGDEVAYPPGVKVEHALPFFRHDLTNENMDPVYKELYRLAPDEFTDAAEPFRELLSMPDRIVNFGMVVGSTGITSKAQEGVFKYELDAKQYHKLVKLSAGIGLGGPTLKQSLSKLIDSFAYKNAPTDLARKAMIYQVGKQYRSLAKKKMMSEIEGVEEEFKRMERKFRLKVQGR